MSDTVVNAHYERKFSDGNYGSEAVSLSWTVTYEDEYPTTACDSEVIKARCNEIVGKVRTAVLTELSKSGSRMVALCAREELGLPPATVAARRPKEDLEDIPF